MKKLKSLRRHAVNICALLVILAAAYVGSNHYVTSEVKVAGITSSERFQSIAQIVSNEHKGSVFVTYVDAKGQPKFIVSVAGSTASSADTSSQNKTMQEYRSALATLLKLSATEVLPTEPSVQVVVFDITMSPDEQIMFATAADLKALPRNAVDEMWLAKLQVYNAPQSSSSSSG